MQRKIDEKEASPEATLKEILLNELRQNIRSNSMLASDVKTAMLIEIDNLQLTHYLTDKIDVDLDKVPHSTAPASPANLTKEVNNSDVPADALVVQPRKNSQSSRRSKFSLTSVDIGKGEDGPKRKVSSSPRKEGTPKPTSPRDIAATTHKKSSPRMFFGDSDSSGSSPKRISTSLKSSSSKKESLKEANFYDSLPIDIDKALVSEYLKKVKPLLNKNDVPFELLKDKDRPHLQLLIIPQREMKYNKELSSRTVILIDRRQIEGTGAYNTVLKGYDLLNKTPIAIKLLSSLTTEESRNEEINNLKTRKWFYGCYESKEGEFALLMKFIPGETLLKTLYETDEAVSKDNVSANYCTHKKQLTAALKWEIIYKLIEELIKLHQKYKLLHRDLKPANVKVYYDNEVLKVRIIDLGEAVPVGSEKIGLCGTNGYTDTDVVNQKPYTIDADTFSMAVIIAEVLSEKNYQQAISEQHRKKAKELPIPWITPVEIQKMMGDVFNLETSPDKFNDFTDHQNNMNNFISLELKKLAKKMLVSRLRNSSLNDEIERLSSLKENSAVFSASVERFFDGKEKMENTLNSINDSCFFQPKKFKADATVTLQSATDQFKSMHYSLGEEDSTLCI